MESTSYFVIIELVLALTKSYEIDGIFDKYGEKDEENNQYKFDKNVQEQVQKELNDLFDLTQDVKTNMLELDWFDDIDLNANQIAAISYMIKDDEDEVEE